MAVRRFGWDWMDIDCRFFPTGALWGFTGIILRVDSRKTEQQEVLELVVGGMQVSVMLLGVVVVGGQGRALRWWSSTW